MELRKTDYAASVRLHNATLPKIWEKQHEKFNEIRALSKSVQDRLSTIPVNIPSDVIIEVGEHLSEGGN